MKRKLTGVAIGLTLAALIVWTILAWQYVRDHPRVIECKAQVMA